MPELRIILLVVGVLFVAGIAGYEWWRSRGTRPLAATPVRDDSADPPAPQKPLPDINVVRDSRVAVSDSLPVIELASTSETSSSWPMYGSARARFSASRELPVS